MDSQLLDIRLVLSLLEKIVYQGYYGILSAAQATRHTPNFLRIIRTKIKNKLRTNPASQNSRRIHLEHPDSLIFIYQKQFKNKIKT